MAYIPLTYLLEKLVLLQYHLGNNYKTIFNLILKGKQVLLKTFG